jgi:hypothetical protein
MKGAWTALLAAFGSMAGAALEPEVIRSVGGLPAHLAGTFEELTVCQQSPSGDYFVFDRRSHSVFLVPRGQDATPRQLVSVGSEPGRVLSPTSFDLGPDNSFVIADTPFGVQRVQMFHETGARLGGFSLPRSELPFVTLQGTAVSGVATVEYTGTSIFVSQPEFGTLVTEYGFDGRVLRSFGDLRSTGQEGDRAVHVALNTGNIVVNPKGGFYYVFLAGIPLFRKYDDNGKLLFERHIEGVEIDSYVQQLPMVWPRRKGGEIPLVLPTVRAAEADAAGNLWISLTVPYTYVYDSSGDKRRTVQFRAAGIISPRALSFTRTGRILVTPGCYAFPASTAADETRKKDRVENGWAGGEDHPPAANGASPARNRAIRGRTR